MSSDHVKNFDTVILPPKREKRLNLFGQIQRLFTFLTPPAIRAVASIPPAVRTRTRLDRGVPLALRVAQGLRTGNGVGLFLGSAVYICATSHAGVGIPVSVRPVPSGESWQLWTKWFPLKSSGNQHGVHQ